MVVVEGMVVLAVVVMVVDRTDMVVIHMSLWCGWL